MYFINFYVRIYQNKEKNMEFALDSTVNKLKLLFLLDKMEIPLTENSIIDIFTSRNAWLKYMDCKEILFQLLDTGFIYKAGNEENDEESRYGITYEGRNCLSHFYLRIPQSWREEATNFAKDNRMSFKRSQEYLSEYYKNEDGSHSVVLKIKEPMVSQSLLEIKLKAPTRHSAISACKKWRENASNIFEYLYDNIIDEQ